MRRVEKKLNNSFARGQTKVKHGLSRLVAAPLPGQAQAQQRGTGRLHAGPLVLHCALGQAGVTHAKREGDHATPAGEFRLLGGFFRADKVLRNAWSSPMRPIRPNDGWSDDPGGAAYNRHVTLPSRWGHEKLWRADRLYDLVIVLDYNILPCRKHRGSAIFLHCARPDFAPTEGCIALRPNDLRKLLPRLAKKVVLTIR
jgi:L,D-peptidoglycan transpeptidase YkuD (ErfK/YbiS/YcfS/YnhG family)